MTETQIKHMVDRFLNWRLPENFRPDAGISFKADFNEHTAHPMRHQPSGTNLFDAVQAEVMVRHMIAGMPSVDDDMLAALKAAEALAFCGMATDCYSRQEIEALCRGTIETFRAAIAKAVQP